MMDVAGLCSNCVCGHLNIRGMLPMLNILLSHENPHLLTSALGAINRHLPIHGTSAQDLDTFLETMNSDQVNLLSKYEGQRSRERMLFEGYLYRSNGYTLPGDVTHIIYGYFDGYKHIENGDCNVL